MATTVELEEIEEYILNRLPGVLERDPRFATYIEGILAQKFPRRDEFARLLDELQQHRQETRQNFDQVDQRFEQVDQRFDKVELRLDQIDQRMQHFEQSMAHLNQRMDQIDGRLERTEQGLVDLSERLEDRFNQLQVSIDRLGRRWGIRNEFVFRQVVRTLLEDSFGVQVQERHIGGEQFDVVIINGVHILVEISASVGQDILQKLKRKRELYTRQTGIAPARFILAVGSINSYRAAALREAGFEVIEPEDE